MRVFQDFATLDLLSGGRAEIMAGRGSFIESFPLFGYDLDDYDELFAEHLELLLRIRESTNVTWRGRTPRADRRTAASTRAPSRTRCRSGSRSAARRSRSSARARSGLPMALAIIGGQPARFAPFAELHRRAAARGRPPAPAAQHQLARLHRRHARSSAIDEAFPAHKIVMDKIGRERGWPPMTRAQFEAGATLEGHNVVGSPEQVIEKILYQHAHLRARPLPAAAERRHAAARVDHARDRALRDRRRARGTDSATCRAAVRLPPADGHFEPLVPSRGRSPRRVTPVGVRASEQPMDASRARPRLRGLRGRAGPARAAATASAQPGPAGPRAAVFREIFAGVERAPRARDLDARRSRAVGRRGRGRSSYLGTPAVTGRARRPALAVAPAYVAPTARVSVRAATHTVQRRRHRPRSASGHGPAAARATLPSSPHLLLSRSSGPSGTA